MATSQAWRVLSTNPITLFTSSTDVLAASTLTSVSSTGLTAAGAYDNTPATLSTGDYLWADFELYLAGGVGLTLTTASPVELYVIPSIDGTNYADLFPTGTTDSLAPSNLYKGAFLVRAEQTITTAQRIVISDVLIPPYLFKIGLRNNTGVSLKDSTPTHITPRWMSRRSRTSK